jgi:alpha-galactosidase
VDLLTATDPWEWMAPYVNDYRTTQDHHDVWLDTAAHGTATIIEENADLASFAGPGHWNFLDFIYTGGQGCPNALYVPCVMLSDVRP